MTRRCPAASCSRILALLVAASTIAIATACASRDAQLQQHREKLASCEASTSAIADAWLAGSVSGTYAVTALQQTLRLVEDERRAFATDPQALLDPRGAQLSQTAERLSRVIAMVMHDIQNADARSVRLHLSDMPEAPSERP